MKRERNHGIDLLRLILMFMICLLHTLGQGGILQASTKGTISYGIFWLIEAIAYCAVDGFAIISGYMSNDEPKKYEKIVNMWFQILFYSFLLTIFFTIIGANNKLSRFDIITCFFPITFNKFWYASSYFILFISMPYLNKFIFNLGKNNAKKIFIVMFILFSGVDILTDTFVLKWGYSPMWLMILYCMGSLAKQIDLFKSKKTIALIFLFFMNLLIMTGLMVFLNVSRVFNYVSPLVLLNGFIIVILFSRIKIKWKNVSKISSLTFGIYLFQLNQVVWNNVIYNSFTFITTKKIFISILYILLISMAIFICGFIIEWIRSKFFKAIKIQILSKKIICLGNNVLKKMDKILE